jgi:bifunctional polynucleotide phosphatase/kinase
LLILYLGQAVANFFTPSSQKETLPEAVTWRVIDDSLIVGRYNVDNVPSRTTETKTKVAGFDFVCSSAFLCHYKMGL